MAKKTIQIDSPFFIVGLERGLADRQRLPLGHVISVLEEVRQMVLDAGREIQKDLGIEQPAADFGLELLAGPGGVVFQPGSVVAHIAITNNVDTGVRAARQVVRIVQSLAKKDATLDTDADRSIVRRLNRLNRLRETDKTELRISLFERSGKRPEEATFNATAAAAASSLQAPVFEVESLTIYGKLFQLRDTDPADEGTKGFWGELRRENGETWRIAFGGGMVDKAASLFRKQVAVTGTAKYYRIAAPKLQATDIVIDEERDYEKAFDELFGADRKVYGEDFAQALREMRGDN